MYFVEYGGDGVVPAEEITGGESIRLSLKNLSLSDLNKPDRRKEQYGTLAELLIEYMVRNRWEPERGQEARMFANIANRFLSDYGKNDQEHRQIILDLDLRVLPRDAAREFPYRFRTIPSIESTTRQTQDLQLELF